MPSKTLHEGLAEYGIGPKLRALRLKKKLGLVELGKHTGLSPALLSKIERGRVCPPLPTLLRISLVFGVGLEYFFAGAREKPVVAVMRKADRIQLPDQPGKPDVAFRFESLDYNAKERRFNSYLAEFFPVSSDKRHPHAHPGFEFIYALQGTLGVVMEDGTEYALAAGDSMYFDSSVPHAYHRRGGRTCSAFVVTSG